MPYLRKEALRTKVHPVLVPHEEKLVADAQETNTDKHFSFGKTLSASGLSCIQSWSTPLPKEEQEITPMKQRSASK